MWQSLKVVRPHSCWRTKKDNRINAESYQKQGNFPWFLQACRTCGLIIIQKLHRSQWLSITLSGLKTARTGLIYVLLHGKKEQRTKTWEHSIRYLGLMEPSLLSITPWFHICRSQPRMMSTVIDLWIKEPWSMGKHSQVIRTSRLNWCADVTVESRFHLYGLL